MPAPSTRLGPPSWGLAGERVVKRERQGAGSPGAPGLM